MSNELRDYLKLSYAELEERNLKAKEQRLSRVPIGKIREKRPKSQVPHRREAHQGRNGNVQRPRRPPPHHHSFSAKLVIRVYCPGFFGRSKLARVWRRGRPRKSCLSGRFKVWIGIFSLRSARVRYSD